MNQKDLTFDDFKGAVPVSAMEKKLSKIWLPWPYFLLLWGFKGDPLGKKWVMHHP